MFYAKKELQKKLQIIIVGGGKVGVTLIEQLSMEGHAITIIDQSSQKVHEITELYDVMGLVGNGASYGVQMEAEIQNADLLIAVTGSDELNLLCCIIAKQVGDCATIARVRTPDYSNEVGYLRDKLGLAMIINPELEAANEIARILALPTALEVNSFANGSVEMVKFKIPKHNEFAGQTIAFLSSKIKNNIVVCAVEREGEVYIPSGDFIIKDGDVISFVASRNVVRSFLEEIGFDIRSVKNTTIIGGGKSTYYLAKQLLAMGIKVKIIEIDQERCEELSVLLPNAVIIHGDGTDQELLKEEGIEYAESFVPLTGFDEENILLTLFAKQYPNTKVITMINHITFRNVIGQLDLGSVIYPRNITSEAIIAYVRAKKNSMNSNIETLYHLFDNKAEAIEFRVEEESEVTNIPLKDMVLRDNLLITCITRNGVNIVPNGQACICMGDSVIIVTTHKGLNDIGDILA